MLKGSFCADHRLKKNISAEDAVGTFKDALESIVSGFEWIKNNGDSLLKVLEEPPAYGVFILLTDNPEKLLTTVRSRCTELKLQALPADIHIPIWLMIICSVVMAAGTAMGGKKIIKSVGMDMVKLEKYQGFSADIAASI